MNLKNDVEYLGRKKLIILVLIDLKRDIEEEIVFVMKKNLYIECLPEKKTFLININVVLK